jgi:hypothetical protein
MHEALRTSLCSFDDRPAGVSIHHDEIVYALVVKGHRYTGMDILVAE